MLCVLHGRGSPSGDGPPCLIGRVSSLGCLSTRSPAVPRGSAPPLAGSVRAPTCGACSRCGCVFPRPCTRGCNRAVTRSSRDTVAVVGQRQCRYPARATVARAVRRQRGRRTTAILSFRVGSTAIHRTGGSAHVRHRASRPAVAATSARRRTLHSSPPQAATLPRPRASPRVPSRPGTSRPQRATGSLSYDSDAVATPRWQQLRARCDDNLDVVRQRCCRSESGTPPLTRREARRTSGTEPPVRLSRRALASATSDRIAVVRQRPCRNPAPATVARAVRRQRGRRTTAWVHLVVATP